MLSEDRKKSIKNRVRSIMDQFRCAVSYAIGVPLLSWRALPLSRQRYLFVLAHPRSGSTLLNRVLATNPEIASYGENHKVYRRAFDLFLLLCRTAARLKNYSLSETYVMDKLVWPKYGMPSSIRHASNVKFIIITREPRATFNSMARLISDWRNEQTSHGIYMDEMDWLEKEVGTINDPARCLCVRYEDLLKNSERVFQTLRTFLHVDAPFSENYDVIKTTGDLRFGDSSENIKAGKFRAPTPAETCCVSDDLLESANQRYLQFQKTAAPYLA